MWECRDLLLGRADVDGDADCDVYAAAERVELCLGTFDIKGTVVGRIWTVMRDLQARIGDPSPSDHVTVTMVPHDGSFQTLIPGFHRNPEVLDHAGDLAYLALLGTQNFLDLGLENFLSEFRNDYRSRVAGRDPLRTAVDVEHPDLCTTPLE